jgi:predicted acylesterase/phospholipase RssA
MMKKYFFILTCILVILLISAGSAISQTPAPITTSPAPEKLNSNAPIQDMSNIRAIMGVSNSKLQESLLQSIKEEDPNDYTVDADGNKIYPVLCISGGAANGAYGAGILKGWTQEGSRPQFKVITGVSTGAITAPMAFLGKDYDKTLEEMFTNMATKDIIKKRSFLGTATGNSMVSTRPLEKLLEKYFDEKFLEAVAKEHQRGRRLYVGTTLLEEQRFVIWDMGAIAVAGDIKLFRKIILASASIPIVFPPQFIEVKNGEEVQKEMHVDGGTITQIFTTYGLMRDAESTAMKMGIDTKKMKGKIYIIRNGYVNPHYKPVKNNLGSIAIQSMDTVLNNQGIGDTYRIYLFMQKIGNDYNLAYIPGDFRPEAKEAFDPNQMKQLFEKGYQDAVDGYKWHKVPSGMESVHW